MKQTDFKDETNEFVIKPLLPFVYMSLLAVVMILYGITVFVIQLFYMAKGIRDDGDMSKEIIV